MQLVIKDSIKWKQAKKKKIIFPREHGGTMH